MSVVPLAGEICRSASGDSLTACLYIFLDLVEVFPFSGGSPTQKAAEAAEEEPCHYPEGSQDVDQHPELFFFLRDQSSAHDSVLLAYVAPRADQLAVVWLGFFVCSDLLVNAIQSHHELIQLARELSQGLVRFIFLLRKWLPF